MWQAILFVVLFAVLYFITAFAEGLRQSATGEHIGYLAMAKWPAIISGVITVFVSGLISIIF